MARKEAMEYRRSCPYDAMGDFSVFEDRQNTEEAAAAGEDGGRYLLDHIREIGKIG